MQSKYNISMHSSLIFIMILQSMKLALNVYLQYRGMNSKCKILYSNAIVTLYFDLYQVFQISSIGDYTYINVVL